MMSRIGRQDEQQLAESQDARYVSMREQIDKKAVQKRSERPGKGPLKAL